MSQDFIHLPAELVGQITQVLAVTTQHHAMLSVDFADNPAARQPHDQLSRGCKALLEQIRDALATPAPEPVIGLDEGDLFSDSRIIGPINSNTRWFRTPLPLLDNGQPHPIPLHRAKLLPTIYGVWFHKKVHRFATEAEAAAFCASLQPPADPALTNALDPTPTPSGDTPAVAEA